MTRLIINADDLGLCPGVNSAIFDAFKLHGLTSTTIMANMPGFQDALEKNKVLGPVPIGVHLTLTMGPSLSRNPLLEENGVFHKKEYWRNPELQYTEELKEAIYQEFKMQIEKVLASGIKPTHLDSHHHIYMTNKATKEIAIQLAMEYKLPLRIDHERFVKDELPASFQATDYIVMNFDLDNAHADSKEYLSSLFNDLKRYQTAELMVHPAYADEYLMEHSSLNLERLKTMDAITSSAFQKNLKDFDTIDYSML